MHLPFFSRPIAAALVFCAFSAGARRAEAQTVPVEIAIRGHVELHGMHANADSHSTCSLPCTVELLPGKYRLVVNGSSSEVAFTGPSRLRISPAYEPLHSVGEVAGLTGAGAFLVSMGVLFGSRDLSVSTSRGFAVAGGCGAVIGALGALVYFLTEGGPTVDDVGPKRSGVSWRQGAISF